MSTTITELTSGCNSTVAVLDRGPALALVSIENVVGNFVSTTGCRGESTPRQVDGSTSIPLT